ncbi:MAG: rhomboid family intramembrane serine protease [Oscillospiraceae bacterium]|nr:rhomboid family intramembrane serine protease [Oscillospiraceae bacterium]
MKKLRQKFERFCYRNQRIGIPNLMLFIVIGNAIVYLMSEMANNYVLYDALCFHRDLILQGQVWRLVTCVFTSAFSYGSIIFVAVSLICYYSLGRAIENRWGTFRFNLFYFSGLFLTEAFVMLFGGLTYNIDGTLYVMPPEYFADLGTYLNLSLFIAYATLYPDTHFLLFFIIPVKAWIFALFDLAVTFLEVFSLPLGFFPLNLFPLVALGNYFLFFGKDVLNLIPLSWQANARRLFRGKKGRKGGAKVIPFPSAGSYEASTASVKAPYTHKCTVCGRTDISDPDLEFRYCSRCNGFHCYCEDHINNHTHIDS